MSLQQKQLVGYTVEYCPEYNKTVYVWWMVDTVAWLGYTQSWIQQKQPVEFDGFGTVANAKHHGLA